MADCIRIDKQIFVVVRKLTTLLLTGLIHGLIRTYKPK